MIFDKTPRLISSKPDDSTYLMMPLITDPTLVEANCLDLFVLSFLKLIVTT
jgi:hypothetical protein